MQRLSSDAPNLTTLHTKPSWHNRAGRIDRTACAVLPASAVWRNASFKDDRSFSGRTHSAKYILSAHELNLIIESARPREISGDRRTSKSNAMRPDERLIPTPHNVAANPNCGATRTKRLCLPFEWTQILRIERWRFSKNEPKSPRSLSKLRNCEQRLDEIVRYSSKSKSELRGYLSYPEARTQHFLICPACKRKCVKLLLPQCTQQEADDAELAHDYLHRIARDHPNAPGDRLEALLHERYSILFHPRRLQCRHCLGLRYGQVRKTAKRQFCG